MDAFGSRHARTVSAGASSWRIEDQFAGARRVTLRWRLAPGAWRLDAARATCTGDRATLAIRTEAPVLRLELVEGVESRHYLERTPLPVLECELALPSGQARCETLLTLKRRI